MRPRDLFALLAIMAGLALVGCGSSHSSESEITAGATSPAGWPDTLRVATLYSPTSFFIYREEKMGYDYTLVSRLAADKGMVLDLDVATSLSQAIEMLDSGAVDLIAYEVPVTAEYKRHIVPCGPVSVTTQVLVQPRKGGEGFVADVTDLPGRDVYVERNSKYQHRLENLNNELGGGINIHTVDRDTIITEDLIAMVSDGEIPLTVVDSDIARLNKTYYPDLDINLQISFPQRAAWGVAPGRQWLADSIDAWMADAAHSRDNALLLKTYFELSKAIPSYLTVDLSSGRVSPYDHLIREAARELGWDWRLLAAMGFIESRFDSSVVSWAGARGIMQIMPGTARAYNVDPASLADPATSLRLAVRIIKSLDKSLKAYVPDPAERQKFVIAAYNAGIAHIYDAIAIARHTGRDPQRWDGNVRTALSLKSNPRYFNLPEVKWGYFRGKQTDSYVASVLEFYDRCRKQIRQ